MEVHFAKLHVYRFNSGCLFSQLQVFTLSFEFNCLGTCDLVPVVVYKNHARLLNSVFRYMTVITAEKSLCHTSLLTTSRLPDWLLQRLVSTPN